MANEITLKLAFLTAVFIAASHFLCRYFWSNPMLSAIPTVGFSDPILSYLSVVRFVFDGDRILKNGYEKTSPGLFKIPHFRIWMVLATGSQLIDDIRRAPDNVLSAKEPSNELLQPEYTLDLLNENDDYHTDVIRSKLTRNISSTFKEVREELVMAMDDMISTHEHKWITLPIQETLQRIICRCSNRIFVGSPLCRDYDYQTLNLTYAVNVIKFGFIISLFPKPLKFIVSRMLSNLPSQIQQEIEFIRPMVEERFAKMEEYGEDWDDKPNDALMWLMSEAKGVERSVEGLARRLLLFNFASIHTTTLATTQVLYRLLSNPEYIEPLRQEVDDVIREEGWTRAGIDKMYKIDSLLRETQRLDGSSSLSVTRLAIRPFTFSNGVTVPARTLVCVPASAVHMDERIFPNPDKFDGFRFAKLRESEGNTTSRYQATSTSNEHLPFGLGRHACPGRFFAINEIKVLLAHIITNYDIKFEEGKGAPREISLAGIRFPRDAKVMFRARQK